MRDVEWIYSCQDSWHRVGFYEKYRCNSQYPFRAGFLPQPDFLCVVRLLCLSLNNAPLLQAATAITTSNIRRTMAHFINPSVTELRGDNPKSANKGIILNLELVYWVSPITVSWEHHLQPRPLSPFIKQRGKPTPWRPAEANDVTKPRSPVCHGPV